MPSNDVVNIDPDTVHIKTYLVERSRVCAMCCHSTTGLATRRVDELTFPENLNTWYNFSFGLHIRAPVKHYTRTRPGVVTHHMVFEDEK